MDTVPRPRCQCWRWSFFLGLLLWPAALTAAPRPPAIPAWQSELKAVRMLEASLWVASGPEPAEMGDHHRRLGEMYRQLAAKYPAQPAVQKAAGDFLWKIGQPDAAVAYWQRAETLDPRDAGTANSLGSAYLRLDRIREACAQFRRAVEVQPEVASYHSDLANVLYVFRHQLLDPPALPDEESVLVQALAEFRRAAALAPSDLRTARAYAETFYALARPDWEQALDAWRAVLALSGRATDYPNSHLARISLRLGRVAEAESYLDRMHDPAFDLTKSKMRAQARGQDAPPATSGR